MRNTENIKKLRIAIMIGSVPSPGRSFGFRWILMGIVVQTLLVGIGAASNIALAGEVPIGVEGCPQRLYLTVPLEFVQATGSKQRITRAGLLDFLHANRGRKTRYSEVLLADWEAELLMPYILVGSLGSIESEQGQIGEARWREVREAALKASREDLDKWTKQGLGNITSGMTSEVSALEARVLQVTSGSPNAFVILGRTLASIGSQPIEAYSAAKTIYSHQCIVFVNVSVDASEKHALERLLDVAANISVR